MVADPDTNPMPTVSVVLSRAARILAKRLPVTLNAATLREDRELITAASMLDLDPAALADAVLGVWAAREDERRLPAVVICKPKRDADSGDWVVRVLVNGKHSEARTYYTSDRDDAHATFRAMVAEVEAGK